jgi:nucleotide-binding universal stress UspA family protein
MIRQLLVGIDGSEYSDMALQYGCYLAKAFQATIHGVHVVDIVQVESPVLHDLAGAIGAAPQFNLTAVMRQNLEARGQQLLAQFRQVCDAEQVPSVAHLVTGVVPTEILRVAQGMDLILLGRGGLHTGLSKALLGSAVETVVRRSGTPTLVTPGHFAAPRKPLLATDGSPSAMAALEVAATFANTLALPLHVVHCAATPAHGQQVLDDAQTRLTAVGIAHQGELYTGNAHEDLVRYVTAREFDLLFMGAFGRQRIVEWVLGSTTQYVLRTCPAPLVLCHAVSHAEPSTHEQESC